MCIHISFLEKNPTYLLGEPGVHRDCECCAPGLIYCRPVPGVGTFKVFSLFAKDICQLALHESCSDRAQRPVRHGSQECPITHQAHCAVLNSLNQNAVPDPCRVVGPQANREDKRNQAKNVGKFPCKSRGCGYHHYNLLAACNKHMTEKHPEELAAQTISLYNKPLRSKQKQRSGCSKLRSICS